MKNIPSLIRDWQALKKTMKELDISTNMEKNAGAFVRTFGPDSVLMNNPKFRKGFVNHSRAVRLQLLHDVLSELEK